MSHLLWPLAGVVLGAIAVWIIDAPDRRLAHVIRTTGLPNGYIPPFASLTPPTELVRPPVRGQEWLAGAVLPPPANEPPPPPPGAGSASEPRCCCRCHGAVS